MRDHFYQGKCLTNAKSGNSIKTRTLGLSCTQVAVPHFLRHTLLLPRECGGRVQHAPSFHQPHFSLREGGFPPHTSVLNTRTE